MPLLILLAAIAFPFVAAPLMWRRMKRVRSHAYRANEPSYSPAWEEQLEAEYGLKLVRTNSPNDDLIALGARESQPPWTLTNQ